MSSLLRGAALASSLDDARTALAEVDAAWRAGQLSLADTLTVSASARVGLAQLGAGELLGVSYHLGKAGSK